MALRKAGGNSTAASSQSALPPPPLPLVRSEAVGPARTGSPAHNSDKMQPQARRSAASGPSLSYRMVETEVLLSLAVSAMCRPFEGDVRGLPYQGSRRSSTSYAKARALARGVACKTGDHSRSSPKEFDEVMEGSRQHSFSLRIQLTNRRRVACEYIKWALPLSWGSPLVQKRVSWLCQPTSTLYT